MSGRRRRDPVGRFAAACRRLLAWVVAFPRRFAAWLAGTGRIARWEVSRSAGTLDRRTLVAVAVVVLAAGAAGTVVVDEGAGLESGIYSVGVDPDSEYAQVVDADDRLVGQPVTYEAFVTGEADVDLYVGDAPGFVEHDGTQTGEAAYDAFRDAVVTYNEERMAAEPDRAAAYPVFVEIEYDQRGARLDGTGAAGGDGSGTAGDDGSDATGEDGSGTTTDGGSGTTTGGGSGTSDGSTGESANGSGSNGSTGGGSTGDGSTSGSDPTRSTDDGETAVPDLGGAIAADGTAGTPGSISPPFPFESLLLAFLFVVPMNFVIQTYGSTILDERVKRRGELLLVSPVSRDQIVAGKSLPYLLALLVIVAGIARVVGGGVLSVLATLPIALAFLSSTFAGAMLARSFKELTFVTVTISVGLTTYVFVPAIFTDVTPIALISPLTLVVMDLQGQAVTAGQYLFSTGPFYLLSVALTYYALGSYREEDMFAQKPIPAKLLDLLAVRLDGYRSVAVCTGLFIPFVFAGQLMSVSLLFAIPEAYALPALLVVAAAMEELAKSVHVYAGFARSRFESTVPVATAAGVASGLGFFAVEKLTHLVQFVGLPELTVGEAVFGPALSLGQLGLALFFLPLALHASTAVVAAVGASRGRTWYAVAFLLATLVHAGYNVGVIALAS